MQSAEGANEVILLATLWISLSFQFHLRMNRLLLADMAVNEGSSVCHRGSSCAHRVMFKGRICLARADMIVLENGYGS